MIRFSQVPVLKICLSNLLCLRKKRQMFLQLQDRSSDKILLSFIRVMLFVLAHLFENIAFTIFYNILLSRCY